MDFFWAIVLMVRVNENLLGNLPSMDSEMQMPQERDVSEAGHRTCGYVGCGPDGG